MQAISRWPSCAVKALIGSPNTVGRVFNIFSAASLGLCVLTILIWTRSYWRVDQIILVSGGRSRMLICRDGVLSAASRAEAGPTHWSAFDQPLYMTLPHPGEFFGFFMTAGPLHRTLIVPLWFPTVIFGAGSIRFIRRVRLRRANRWREFPVTAPKA